VLFLSESKLAELKEQKLKASKKIEVSNLSKPK
jgi:hypothetical protein